MIEDDPTLRLALTVALERENLSVCPLADGRSLETALANVTPDLAVLDVRLPQGPDGYTIARWLRGHTSVAILFLSAADTLSDRLKGFASGGDDYLVKPFAMPEFLARVQALLRRAGRLVSPRWEFGGLVVDHAEHTVTRYGEALDLTLTEFALLAQFTQNPRQVVTREELLAAVWGYDGYGPNLVEVHVSSLRRKLEKYGPRLIYTVRGVGYRFVPDSEEALKKA